MNNKNQLTLTQHFHELKKYQGDNETYGSLPGIVIALLYIQGLKNTFTAIVHRALPLDLLILPHGKHVRFHSLKNEQE